VYAPAGPRRAWLIAALLTVYVLAAKLGLTFAFVHASASAVWPPTGIALGAFLIFGFRIWPAIFIGAFLVNVTTAGSVASSLGIATGNTLEGLIGAYLVNRFAGGAACFERARTIFPFVAFAAPGDDRERHDRSIEPCRGRLRCVERFWRDLADMVARGCRRSTDRHAARRALGPKERLALPGRAAR
jgi:hypothetical protein